MVATLDVVDTLTEPLNTPADASHALTITTLRMLTASQRQQIETLLTDGKLSQREIGYQVGCLNQVVSDVNQDLKVVDGKLSLTDTGFSQIISNKVSKRMVDTLDRIQSKTKSQDVRAYVAAFSDLFKVARLLAGESTQNIATKNLSALIVRVDNKIKARAAKKNKGKGGGGRGAESGGEKSGE